MDILLSSVHILSCILLIILVLIQQGKGADVGATLGGGDSSSVFGPTAENPLRNFTTILALVFMVTSVSLAYKSRFGTDEEGKLFIKTSVDSPESQAIVENTDSEKSTSVEKELGIPTEEKNK